jgi:RNA polymerase sigma-70 factor, ECF subfamily
LSIAAQDPILTISELRPKLHRYCARVVGSVVDGEDIVQESIVKALEALRRNSSIANLEGWLFRIAHNTSLDFLRQRSRQINRTSSQEMDLIADSNSESVQKDIAAASLHTFMFLPVAYRSTVILKDVLGYSVQEVCDITGMTLPSTKAALHRGRTKLREIGSETLENRLPALDQKARARLAFYVDRFNARDFDAVRNLLAEDVHLEMVNKTRMRGKVEVGEYFTNYSRLKDWSCSLGRVDQRLAIVVRQPVTISSTPAYFILLQWDGEQVVSIRDFVHARYVTQSAEIIESI